MRRISQSLIPGLTALLLIACGQTGALYLPDEQAAPASVPAAEEPPGNPDDAQDPDQDQDEPKQEKEKLGNQELR